MSETSIEISVSLRRIKRMKMQNSDSVTFDKTTNSARKTNISQIFNDGHLTLSRSKGHEIVVL